MPVAQRRALPVAALILLLITATISICFADTPTLQERINSQFDAWEAWCVNNLPPLAGDISGTDRHAHLRYRADDGHDRGVIAISYLSPSLARKAQEEIDAKPDAEKATVNENVAHVTMPDDNEVHVAWMHGSYRIYWQAHVYDAWVARVPRALRDVFVWRAQRLDSALGGGDPRPGKIARSVVVLLDRRDCLSKNEAYDKAMKELNEWTQGLEKLNDMAERAGKPDPANRSGYFEWSVMDFDGARLEMEQEFGTRHAPLGSQRREIATAPGGQVGDLAWAVTNAVSHLLGNGHGNHGRVVTLTCSGGDPHGFRKLNDMLKFNLRGSGGGTPQARLPEPNQTPPQVGSIYDALLAGVGAQPSDFDETLERIEVLAKFIEMSVQTDVVAMNVAEGSEAHSQLQALAEAGGGTLKPVSSVEEIGDALTSLMPDTEGATGDGDPQVAGGGTTTGGTEPGDTTLGAQDAPRIIICHDVVNGQPVGAADSFATADQVCGYMTFADRAESATWQAAWSLNGQVIFQQPMSIPAGSGNVSARLRAGTGQPLPPGQYELALTADGRTVTRAQFTVGATQPAITQPPVTQTTGTDEFVLCRAIADGVPVEAGETFSGVASVFLLMKPREVTGQMMLTVLWGRPDGSVETSVVVIAGPGGSAWSALQSQGGQLTPGSYSVMVLDEGQTLYQKGFTIR